MEGEEHLSVAEASKAIGKSEKTIRRWCDKGKLQATKPGKVWLIDPSSVEELRQQFHDDGGCAESDGSDDEIPVEPDNDQNPETTEEDTSSFAEATEDEPGNGQAVDSVAEQEEDACQTDGRMQEKSDQLCEQAEALRSRIDRIGQSHAGRLERVEQGNRKLSAVMESLKGTLGVLAAVLAVSAVVVVGIRAVSKNRLKP